MGEINKDEWAHSPLGPSAASRWLACPGSVLATKGMEDVSSEYAIEGTAAHYLAEACAKSGEDPKGWIGKIIPVKESDGVHEVPVTVEMADSVIGFLEFCEDIGHE